jgi:putative intracellular protease/amidase/YHS domain-containing protein
MKRRDFLRGTAALGLVAATRARADAASTARASAAPAAAPLTPPPGAPVPVAFLVSDGAVVIDFCGPWEVFQDVNVPGRSALPFRLYTVAETTRPIRASAGLRIVPDYDLAHAPAPRVVVIPAQSARSEAVRAWIRKAAKGADLTMSVCTGAFLLAGTGLLAGKPATTHHASYRTFAMQFPDVKLQRGARFVEAGEVASAGGLSSGIDLALRVVERYYGRDVASATARYMEYQGQGWLDPASNAAFAEEPVSTADHPLCPVCQMEVDARTAPRSTRGGKTYLFCMPAHKALFDAAPERFVDGAR